MQVHSLQQESCRHGVWYRQSYFTNVSLSLPFGWLSLICAVLDWQMYGPCRSRWCVGLFRLLMELHTVAAAGWHCWVDWATLWLPSRVNGRRLLAAHVSGAPSRAGRVGWSFLVLISWKVVKQGRSSYGSVMYAGVSEGLGLRLLRRLKQIIEDPFYPASSTMLYDLIPINLNSPLGIVFRY